MACMSSWEHGLGPALFQGTNLFGAALVETKVRLGSRNSSFPLSELRGAVNLWEMWVLRPSWKMDLMRKANSKLIAAPIWATFSVCFLPAMVFCSSPAGCAAKAPTTGQPVQALTSPPQLPLLNWQKRSDWIDVKTDVTPGAVGDGIQDDTQAIQTALDRLQDVAGAPHVVYLPPGTYRITGTLTLTKIDGALIVGHARATRILWGGPGGGVMFHSNGVAYSRFVGLIWDGAGKAAVGIDHASKTYYETQVTHQDEAFFGFTAAGIRVGYQQDIPSAEILYRNCLFQDCDSGVEFLSWNDYDNDFDGCVFRDCGTGINCQKGNVYVRDCNFQRSRERDILLCSHSHSIRRCVSVNSAQFLATETAGATLELMVQDCRVDGWTGAEGSITLKMRGPSIIFDCVFTHPPDNAPPIRLTNDSSSLQTLAVSNNSAPGSPNLVDKGRNADIKTISSGTHRASLIGLNTLFFRSREPVPGRIYDVKTEFGAKGDSRTDDTAAVSAAVQAAREHGNNAIAYMPAGTYLISRAIPITGSNYRVGGSGYASLVRWTGGTMGTMFDVRDPQNVTLEQMRLEAAADTVARIRQTSAGRPSEMTYDGIHVKSSFLDPSDLGGPNGHVRSRREVEALECLNLPAGTVIHAPHFDGTMHLIGCGQAAILGDFQIDGVIHVTGASQDTGFLGLQTRISSGNPVDIVVTDNQSLVIGDTYTESTQKHVELSGSDAPGAAPGHVTIRGVQVMTYDTEPITLDNYFGRFTYIGAHFVYNIDQITARGAAPTQVLLLGNTFWKGQPNFAVGEGAKLTTWHNVVAGQPQPDMRERVPDRVTRQTARFPTASPDLPGAAEALEDFRDLGYWDLKMNHPAVLGGGQ